MGTVGGQLLLLVGYTEVSPQTQEALIAMAKAVAVATATLVTNARCAQSSDGLPTRVSSILVCHVPSPLPSFPPCLSSFLRLQPCLSLPPSSRFRNVAAKCEDQALQRQVIVAAKEVALATQAIIACTKVLAPCIDSPLCQEQLIEACKVVTAAVEGNMLAAQVRTMLPYM